MEDLDDERHRVAALAAEGRYSEGVMERSISYTARIFDRFFRGTSCLELGPAEGLMTPFLAERFDDLWLVDGSVTFCDDLRRAYPKATIVAALFEELDPGRRFDSIVIGRVLEHVSDPAALLARVRRWLTPRGRVLAVVPNARSVHRQAAVLMGLLRSEHELNDTDLLHGHRRVYDPESFRAEFVASGYRIEAFGGYWMKPLSNSQLEQSWTGEMVDAFMQLGERYPDIAAEIYVIGEVPSC